MAIPSVSAQCWTEWTLVAECDDGWSHHGLATLGDGTIVAFHPRGRELLLFDPDGEVVQRVVVEAIEAHDIEVVDDGLWLADCGHRLCLSSGSRTPFVSPPVEEAVGRVWLVDPANGRTLRTIDGPDDEQFLPTAVALDPAGRGLWVADGYGSNRVFLLDDAGAVVIEIGGLDTPHGLEIDHRGHEPVVLISERGAARLTVHALDGSFLRHDGVGALLAPCATAVVGDHVHVADLAGRVTVLDRDGNLVAHLGAHGAHGDGWPNANDDDGRTVPPTFEPGRFVSAHGITAVDGDVVVTEWVLGGRWVRYSPTTMNER